MTNVDNNRVTSPRPGFAPVTLELLLDKRIEDPTTVAVYAALSSFANYDTADCFPSHVKIAERARCDERTVRRHIDELARLAYLEKRARPGFSNIYHLADPWGRKAPAEGSDASDQPAEGWTPVTRGVDMGDQGGWTPVTDEREGENESKERERTPAPETAQTAEPDIPLSPASAPPQTLRDRLQASAKKILGAETPFAARGESVLLRGELADQIVEAWEIMLREKPAGAAYFDRDYVTRWKPKTKRRVSKTEAPVSRPSELAHGYADDNSIAQMLAKVHELLPWEKKSLPVLAETA